MMGKPHPYWWLYHLMVHMIGGLVRNDEIWGCQQGGRQGHAPLLAAAEAAHQLAAIGDAHLQSIC